MADEVITEVWEIKDCIAKEHGYNLDALVEHLRGVKLISGSLIPARVPHAAERKGIDRESEASHDLIQVLDEPVEDDRHHL